MYIEMHTSIVKDEANIGVLESRAGITCKDAQRNRSHQSSSIRQVARSHDPVNFCKDRVKM